MGNEERFAEIERRLDELEAIAELRAVAERQVKVIVEGQEKTIAMQTRILRALEKQREQVITRQVTILNKNNTPVVVLQPDEEGAGVAGVTDAQGRFVGYLASNDAGGLLRLSNRAQQARAELVTRAGHGQASLFSDTGEALTLAP